jgi:lytic murein transglycosylase
MASFMSGVGPSSVMLPALPCRAICLAVIAAVQLGAAAAAREPSADDLPACLAKLRAGAGANRVSLADFDRFARGIKWQAKSIEYLNSQPETVLTWSRYLDRVITPTRVRRGQKIFAQWKSQAEKVAGRYGSDADIVTAIWGVESDFGASLGSFPVLDAWATLACYKPSELRLTNFYGSMRLLASGRVPVDGFTGSWSGAFGLTQFIPTSFESYAADGDDDGKVDIYSSVPDAMASAARHLNERSAWVRGLPAAIEVAVPAPLLQELSSGSDDERWVRTPRPLSAWAGQRVTRSDGASLLSLGVAPTTALRALLTEGAKGRVFLVSSNFDALMSYNKSTKYAIAVSLLAKRVQEAPDAIGTQAATGQDGPAMPAVPASAASANPRYGAAAVPSGAHATSAPVPRTRFGGHSPAVHPVGGSPEVSDHAPVT